MDHQKFSCLIIGGTSLLIECANKWIVNGHVIKLIVTDDNDVERWAKGHDIEVIRKGSSDYLDRVMGMNFDYLFSIVNLDILPKAIINAPAILAINYHDGPLPKYGGIHATSWAIANQEPSHGISWHEMLIGVDEGRIINQQIFDIEEGESAFTLNLKCFEHAIEGFDQLVSSIETGSLQLISQDLSERSYVGKYKRPKQLAVIDWNRPSKEIVSFVKSLDFEHVENPLGIAKVHINNRFFQVKEAQSTGTRSSGRPGVVESIGPNYVEVSTTTESVKLRDFKTLCGQELDFNSITNELKEGADLNFYCFDNEQAIYEESAKREVFWVRKYQKAVKVTKKKSGLPKEPSYRSSIPLTDYEMDGLQNNSIAAVISLLGAFIAWSRRGKGFCVGLRCSESPVEGYFFDTHPLVMEDASGMSFEDIASDIELQLREITKNEHCPIDIFSRYSSLNSQSVKGNCYEYDFIVDVNESIDYDNDYVLDDQVRLNLSLEDNEWNVIAGPKFDKDLLERFTKYYSLFASSITTKPSSKREALSGLSLISGAQIAEIDGLNDTRVAMPNKSVCEIILDKASETPNAIAVISSGTEYSYQQFQDRVSEISGCLISLGIKSGDRIGILLNRSFDMVAAFIATMKVSAVYVPLDPIYPPDRLRHMIEDSGLKVLISVENILSKLENYNGSSLLLDKDMSGGTDDLAQFPGIEDSAYIIYTSGSTGKPKGVEINHKSLTNFILSMAEEPGLSKGDRLLSVTTVCFDIAALEMYLPLTQGATLELCTEMEAKDGFALLEKLEQGRITALQATPTTWEMLIAAGWEGKEKIKAMCGGEPLRRELALKLIPRCFELWNMYGPTETTIWSSIKLIKDADEITVGRPIANTTMYVLDESLKPVWPGEKGELFIGGAGVAVGYWNREELTKERFVSQSIFNRSPERLYRTGDAAKLSTHNEVVCLGRMDNQIKLNGYRIELGEIESTIESISGIEKCVVILFESKGESRLHAFLLMDDEGKQPKVSELSASIATKLPEYMVPSEYQFVSEFSLTLNGKVDRKELLKRLDDRPPKTTAKDNLDLPRSNSIAYKQLEQNLEDNKGSTGSETELKQAACARSVTGALYDLLANDLENIVKELIHLDDIDRDLPFGQYGFNSLGFTRFSAEIRNRYNVRVSPATFYSHSNLNKLVDFLIDGKYSAEISEYYREVLVENYRDVEEPLYSGEQDSVAQKGSSQNSGVSAIPLEDTKGGKHINGSFNSREPIAVIGMSVKMPQADNLDEYWENLISGKDCVTHIPESRWDWKNTVFEKRSENPYKWGGFIPHAASFDASFFKISPREAELMDPQQRLFLQASYHAIEDAGYCPDELNGSDTGVYVGVVTSDYWDLIQREDISPDGYTISGNINCVIANRISYHFNFTGPSSVIDTACSSSLVALHRAVQAMRSGECSQAVVGGVNIITSPYIHHSFSKNGMLSKDGRCMSFDHRANGYVRSEGIAAVILKPLSAAERDGDKIYGTILGTAENHGGKANSLSAPSGEAQSQLIQKAIKNANVDPNTISYIEAHGSGTPLGDPIEIAGIQNAYESLGVDSDQQGEICGIGSVKSNVGHLEAVAGLAGLVKVLLSLKNEVIPGMPNYEAKNPHIDLNEKLFQFVSRPREWKRKSGVGNGAGRRAGVSSFGFGGVNAHVIVEEYQARDESQSGNRANALLISAPNKDKLERLVQQYLVHTLSDGGNTWEEICYTSQVGRQHFDERLIVCAASKQQAKNALEKHVDRWGSANEVLSGNVREQKEILDKLFSNIGNTSIVKTLIEQKQFNSIAQFWLAGSEVNWRALYEAAKIKRASLPLHPFAQTTFWLPNKSTHLFEAELQNAIRENSHLDHPFYDSLAASCGNLIFSLDPKDPIVGDHIVDSKVIFPAVGYLEFARLAGDQFNRENLDLPVVKLKNNVWFHALDVGFHESNKKLSIRLENRKSKVIYTIESMSELSSGQVHARGEIEYGEKPSGLVVTNDVSDIRKRCNLKLERKAVYDLFSQLKFEYKTGYMPIEEVYLNDKEALSRITLPEKFENKESIVLHPSLLEGGIQTVIGILSHPSHDSSSAYLPFSMSSITINEKLSSECYIHAKLVSDELSERRGVRTFDIDIYDISGTLLVRIEGYSLKTLNALADNGNQTSPSASNVFHCFKKTWAQEPLSPIEGFHFETILLFSNEQESVDLIQAHIGNDIRVIQVMEGDGFTELSPSQFVSKGDKESLSILLEQIGEPLDAIIYGWGYERGATDESNVSEHIEQTIIPLFNLCSILSNPIYKGINLRLLCLAHIDHGEINPVQMGIGGLLRSLYQETRALKGSLVCLEALSENNVKPLIAEIAADQCYSEIKIQDGSRQVLNYKAKSVPVFIEENKFPVKPDAIYLVTGGAGAIGRKIIEHLHSIAGAKFIVIGRRPLSSDVKLAWNNKGVNYQYHSADLSRFDQIQSIIQGLGVDASKIKGVIHCAGSIDDGLLSKKSSDQIYSVIQAKAVGLYTLDILTKNLQLDFFCCFSSISSVMGNMGQTDYGYANAVIDQFVENRSQKFVKGERSGISLSINWPLWLDGGMQADEVATNYFKKSTGIHPITTETGMSMLAYAVNKESGQVILSAGDDKKILGAMSLRSSIQNKSKHKPKSEVLLKSVKAPLSHASAMDQSKANLSQAVVEELITISEGILKVDSGSITQDTRLADAGFDSISNTELTTAINDLYSVDVTPIIFFEYETLGEVTEFLLKEYRDSIVEHCGEQPSAVDNIILEATDSEQIGASAHSLRENGEALKDLVIDELKSLSAATLKISKEQISADEKMADLGFDSISNTELSTAINDVFDVDMTPVVFFECDTLAEVGEHLIDEYSESLERYADEKGLSQRVEHSEKVSTPITANTKQSLSSSEAPSPEASHQDGSVASKNITTSDIAIVGMQAALPGSNGLDDFWEKLLSGTDFVGEIPENRWSWQEVYGEAGPEGKTRSKWGAFLNHIDQFDADFFGISESDAQLMDPQQRMFLQLVWHTIEDAGYSVESFAGSKTGLYAGLSNRDYSEYLAKQGVGLSPQMSFGNNNAFLVNRISYLLDFNGPSEAVDTLCSSSLVALQRAVLDIQNGICDQAVVGGISLLVSPRLSSVFEQASMLSEDGRCKPFDEHANGFVRGEGGGAIFVKPLDKAVSDGDNILAVIKGSFVNHGGRANSLTAPNLKIQKQLFQDAYKRAKINPATVSLIETHGTGTKLGDPIEIKAMKKAFEEWGVTEGGTEKACALGALKSNIGHLESASGIASLIKVLLCMRHKTLPKQIHLQKENPYLELSKTPFYLVTENQPWVAKTGGDGTVQPRRAGVTSFGAGGVNAHIILEEYLEEYIAPQHVDNNPINLTEDTIVLLTLSAKTDKSLRHYAADLLAYTNNHTVDLTELAYTLQQGRSNHAVKLSIEVANIIELKAALEPFISGEHSSRISYSKNGEIVYLAQSSSDKLTLINEKWLSGEVVDWSTLYIDQRVKRMSLPGYSFSNKSYWVEKKSFKPTANVNFDKQNYTENLINKDFNQGEAYLAGHKVFGDEVLLGVTYPSMAIEFSRNNSNGANINSVKNVVFHEPLVLEKNNSARVVVSYTGKDKGIDFKTYFQVKGSHETKLSSVGRLTSGQLSNDVLPISALMNKIASVHQQNEVYKLLRDQGVDYSGSLLTLHRVLLGENVAIGEIELRDDLINSTSDYQLHPVWLDSAIVCGKFAFLKDQDALYIPLSIDQITFKTRPSRKSYCVVKKTLLNEQILKFDVSICDRWGTVSVEAKGMSCKRVLSQGQWSKKNA